MRHVVLTLPALLLAAGLSAQAPPACGAAALAAAPDIWDPGTAVAADLTLDGTQDVVFWKRDGASVVLYIAACDGAAVEESWRYRIPLPAECPPAQATVEAASLRLDPALVERVCASGASSECQHLRRENERRQALEDAGGRELRVGGPACHGPRLRWSLDMGGFMKVGG